MPEILPSDHTGSTAASTRSLPDITRLFIRALKALGDSGETDLACRIAAEAWSLMRSDYPREAEKLNGALHYLTRPSNRLATEETMQNAVTLDVRHLVPAQRHTLIFDTCARLSVGDSIVLVNDHDPKPLYYQFEAEQPGQFGWEYVHSGPEVWRVRITRKKAVQIR